MASNSCSCKNTQQALFGSNRLKKTGRNNPNTQNHKCSVSSTISNTCICSVYLGRSAANFENLYGLVSLRKLSARATRRLAEGTISRSLLWKVLYRMLPLLPIMQELFWYHWRHWVKPHFICRLFSLWVYQFLLASV